MKSMMFKLPKTLSTVIIGRIHQNLWNLEFSSYFKIFICGFWISKFTFGRFRPESGQSTWFSKRIHLNVFSHQRGSGLSQIQYLYTKFCEKPWKIGFHSVWHVEYSTLVEYSTGPEISIIKVFITSATVYIFMIFSNASRMAIRCPNKVS